MTHTTEIPKYCFLIIVFSDFACALCGVRRVLPLGELVHLAALRTLVGLRLEGSRVTPASTSDVDQFRAITGCEDVRVPMRLPPNRRG